MGGGGEVDAEVEERKRRRWRCGMVEMEAERRCRRGSIMVIMEGLRGMSCL